MRLALDFVVHLVMLSLFSYVTIDVTGGPLTFAEKVLIFHVTVSSTRSSKNRFREK